jgi:hypothetical protein
MNIEEIKNIIEEFNAIIDSDVFPVPENEFMIIIDKLALCSNHLNFIEYNESDENLYSVEPKLNYNDVYKIVGKKFPNYGYYNIPKDIIDKISDTEVVVADSIDDICDIYLELKKICWRFENTSQLDALWNLQFGYTAHWGRHLRDLQWYVYNFYFHY